MEAQDVEVTGTDTLYRISETIRCRKLYLVETLVRTCRCATSWCDLDLTFDLVMVTMSFKILDSIRCRRLILGSSGGTVYRNQNLL